MLSIRGVSAVDRKDRNTFVQSFELYYYCWYIKWCESANIKNGKLRQLWPGMHTLLRLSELTYLLNDSGQYVIHNEDENDLNLER